MGEIERSRADEQALDVTLGAAARERADHALRSRAELDALRLGDVEAPSRVRELLEDPSFEIRRNRPEDGEAVVPETQRSRLELLVPPRFQEATFASYHARSPSQRAALSHVETWMRDAMAGLGPMLALVGDQGCGKSHLLYAAVRELTRRRVDVYARPWYRLADELRYGGPSVFAPDAFDEPHEVRARLWKQRLVFLDEVRETASTDFDYTELAKYACHAYDGRVALFLTTNANPIDLTMGPHAASRFTQVSIVGPNFRHPVP